MTSWKPPDLYQAKIHGTKLPYATDRSGSGGRLVFVFFPCGDSLVSPYFLGTGIVALPWYLAGEKASFGLVDLGNSCSWDLDDPNGSEAKNEARKPLIGIFCLQNCLRDSNNPVCWNRFIFPWKSFCPFSQVFLKHLVFPVAHFVLCCSFEFIHWCHFIDIHPRL